MPEGLVLLDGRPAAGQRVLALSSDMTSFLAAAVTDEEGRYRLELPGRTAVVLMAKIQGPVLAVAAQERPDFRFDSRSPAFCTVRGEIVPVKGARPPHIEISVTPAHLEGVPAAAETFFLRYEARVVESAFYGARIGERTFALRLQRGTWRIAGGHIDYGRPTAVGQPPPNVIVGSIETAQERELPGEPFGGFTLDVHGDVSIKLRLAILPDDQLSPANGG